MSSGERYLGDWNLFEKIWLISFVAINVYLYFAFRGVTPLVLVSSILGMLRVLLAAKGRISNFYVGIINVVLYGYITYIQGYFGTALLNFIYLLPMQFVGLVLWGRNRTDEWEKADVKIQLMDNKSRILWVLISFVAAYAFGVLLQRTGSRAPFIDSTSVVLSIAAMLLLALRYVEQWVLWIVIDSISIITWFLAPDAVGSQMSVFIMWAAYLVNSVYGLVNWIRLYDTQEA
jgi:nicotinamide mononucleotide transporter